MSRLGELGPDMRHLPTIILEYETALEQIEEHLTVKGKTLEVALKEQSIWPVYYDQRRAELKTLSKHLSVHVDATRGRILRRYLDNMSRQLSERQLNAYIDHDADFIKIHELYLEVEELHDKYQSAVECFNRRGFALRDITLARTNEIQTALL